MLSGSARAKLILFGEHAAVHGYPAVGVPLEAQTRVDYLEIPGAPWTFPGMEGTDAEALGRVAALIAPEGRGGEIRVVSTVPRSVGFGSSAALCVALAGALSGSTPPYGREVWARAHRAESLFHGRPSGVDTGLAMLDGFHSFRPSPPALPEERRLPSADLCLVVGAVPRETSTARLVSELGSRMTRREAKAVAALASLGAIAVEAEGMFLSRSVSAAALGELADRAQGHLADLGLSTPATDLLLVRGRELGCLGGKLSGGGGGGALYVVCRDPGHAASVAAALGGVAADLGLRDGAWLHPLIFRS